VARQLDFGFETRGKKMHRPLMFGLGGQEILLLAMIGVGTVLVFGLIYLFSTRRKHNETNDSGS
jgi:hypothetical protein